MINSPVVIGRPKFLDQLQAGSLACRRDLLHSFDTPRLNKGQPGIPIPGHDHWGSAISALLASGGLRGGQAIGETNAKGEHPVKRPLTPADLLATIYHVLGIDPRRTFQDHTGRPQPILDEGQPIAEAI